jgi:serine/threonine-protein kinase HipA
MRSPVGELQVRLGDRVVGVLRADQDTRLCFTYSPGWLADEQARPISLSLPLRSEEYAGGAGHWFFANLLPEGAVRQAVCARLGISIDNDMALLRAIGGECAGALSVVDAERPSLDPDEQRYEELGDSRLQELISRDEMLPLLIGGSTTRLSLAGAQDKLPVAVLDGRIHLPLAGAPSTHILKLPNPRYAHLTCNEAYVTGLAARLGLEVVSAELLDRTAPPVLLTERYDRRPSEDPWPVTRLHQEDLCQALGLPPARKYEQEGGPSLAGAIELVRAHVRQPLVDVRRAIEWQAFNVVAGNSDGHGKNLSLLYEEGGIRLAPFYDLLSTRQYAGLDRMLAMGVGARRDPDQLHSQQWAALAAELGIGAGLVNRLVKDLALRCADEVEPWSREFRERHADRPILQRLPDAIRRRALRLGREHT